MRATSLVRWLVTIRVLGSAGATTCEALDLADASRGAGPRWLGKSGRRSSMQSALRSCSRTSETAAAP